MMCAEHLAQLRRQYDDLHARGGEVLVIVFDPAERAERWAREQALPFPVLVDPERRVYRAYGLERVAPWRLALPIVWLRFARLFAAGRRQAGPPQNDPLQLGGDFVVDPRGRLAFAHACQDPTDRPSVEALLAAVGQSPGAGVRE